MISPVRRRIVTIPESAASFAGTPVRRPFASRRHPSSPMIPTVPSSLRRAAFAVLAVFAVLALASPARAAAQLPTGFQDQPLVSALDWPVGLAFLPDGRLVTCELKSRQ